MHTKELQKTKPAFISKLSALKKVIFALAVNGFAHFMSNLAASDRSISISASPPPKSFQVQCGPVWSDYTICNTVKLSAVNCV